MDLREKITGAVYARMPDAAAQPATTAARIVEEENQRLRAELAAARGSAED